MPPVFQTDRTFFTGMEKAPLLPLIVMLVLVCAEADAALAGALAALATGALLSLVLPPTTPRQQATCMDGSSVDWIVTPYSTQVFPPEEPPFDHPWAADGRDHNP